MGLAVARWARQRPAEPTDALIQKSRNLQTFKTEEKLLKEIL